MIATDLRAPLLLGCASAALVLFLPPVAAAAIVVLLIALALGNWTLLAPTRWLFLFFPVLLLSPPVPFPIGDAGAHPAPLIALLGVCAGVLRLKTWRTTLPPVALALLGFFAMTFLSLGAAALYSGPAIALGALFRVALLGISVFVFLYTLRGPSDFDDPLRLCRWLFFTALIAAAFGCVDYYYQLPAPAGFGAQFIWLEEGVLRRAQGLFYEASTLGNFCAFFLAMIAVAFVRPRHQTPCSRPVLALGAVLFGAALILSYSRASVLNILVALAALAWLRRERLGRILLTGSLFAVPTIAAVAFLVPSFFASYAHRLALSVQYLWTSPDGVLSGRLSHWKVVADFLLREPWHAIFGVGYKTLPYSTFIGATVITDNTWLSLLAETGAFGVLAFAVFNFLALRTGLRAARHPNPRAAFFGEWIFCFWLGEMAQMFSGDLITYWRVLPLFFWVLATAARESEDLA